MEFPAARSDLDVNEAPDGLVIYDVSTDRVHYLNPTAAAVFVLCTGELSEAGIAAEVQSVFGMESPPLEDVQDCLRTLVAEGLVR